MKRIIVEFDYDYFDSLFYQLRDVDCFTKLVSFIVNEVDYIYYSSWFDCNPFKRNSEVDLSIPPAPCVIPITSSPVEIIIAPGYCYESVIPGENVSLRWYCTFFDSFGTYVDYKFGNAILPVDPLLIHNCIKYVLNPSNVVMYSGSFGIEESDFTVCDEDCDCCNCC